MSYLDLGVLAVLLISGLLAMVRGFVREVLSIASWATAAFAAWAFYKMLLPYVKEHIANEMVATAISVAVIFLTVLIIVALITVRISDAVLDSRIGFLDRTLGFLYGLVRGIVPVVVAFMIFEFLAPDAKSRPVWVNNAKTLPMLENASAWVKSKLPAELVDDMLAKVKKPKTEGAQPTEPAVNAPQPVPQAPGSSAPPTQPQKRSEAPAPKQDRAAMQVLVNGTQVQPKQ